MSQPGLGGCLLASNHDLVARGSRRGVVAFWAGADRHLVSAGIGSHGADGIYATSDMLQLLALDNVHMFLHGMGAGYQSRIVGVHAITTVFFATTTCALVPLGHVKVVVPFEVVAVGAIDSPSPPWTNIRLLQSISITLNSLCDWFTLVLLPDVDRYWCDGRVGRFHIGGDATIRFAAEYGGGHHACYRH